MPKLISILVSFQQAVAVANNNDRYSSVGIPRSPLSYGRLSIFVAVVYMFTAGSQGACRVRSILDKQRKRIPGMTAQITPRLIDSLETDARLVGNM